MSDTFTAQRQALGDAYLGDTKSAKALFTDPTTFDQRVISLLQGLGQDIETPLPSAITTADIATVMRVLDPVDNAKRVALLGLLIGRASTDFDTQLLPTSEALTITPLYSGGPDETWFNDGSLSPNAKMFVRNNVHGGIDFDLNIPLVKPAAAFGNPQANHVKFALDLGGFASAYGQIEVDLVRPLPWIPVTFARAHRGESLVAPPSVWAIPSLIPHVPGGGHTLPVGARLAFEIHNGTRYFDWTDCWSLAGGSYPEGATATFLLSGSLLFRGAL